MTFKAILQALEGAKIYRCYKPIFGLFIRKINKIRLSACLQTLKVTCTFVWKNNIGGGAVFMFKNEI